jgi:Flp pilus assembly protein TadG
MKQVSLFQDKYRNFLRQEQGAVAVIFGLTVIPLLGFAGAAMDYSRASSDRTKMQHAADATALMLAKDGRGMTDAQLRERGGKFFKSLTQSIQFADQINPVEITRNDTEIKVVGSGVVPTTLGRFIGQDQTPIRVNATTNFANKKIELALVLDNTGSMGQLGKMTALKDASYDLLNTLEKAAYAPDVVKIAIVPFNTQVRVEPSDNKFKSWVGFKNDAQRNAWEGYFNDRTKPYDTNDTASNIGQPETLFNAAEWLRENGQNIAPIRPLTNNFNALRATIGNMQAAGWTNVAIGAAWGLHALSPQEPLGGGVAYGTKGVDKFMVLLTDGLNTKNAAGDSVATMDQRTALSCQSAKAEGIKVYSIRVIEGNENVLRGCATRPEMYFNVQNASELKPIFQKIAAEISAIRITN